MDSATTNEHPRLLLIEDDEIFVAMTRLILTERGFADHRTLIAGSIADATPLLRAGDVDLILADLSLPDAYGLEVVRECRDLAPGVPIIVLTACRDVELALSALEKGAQDYLIKGEFNDEDLLRAIRYAFARSHAAAELRSTLHALEESNRQLEESNDQLEQYATIASHDLRAPVRTARVLAGRMMASPELASDAPSVQLGLALDGCLSRLETMLEGLLDYAQARDLSSSGDYRDETVQSLVDEILVDMDADLREADADVQVFGGDISLRAHPVLIRSLIHNVVRNSVKYRSDRPLRIVISTEPAEAGKVRVKVADNGIGIDEKYRTRVFGMFERLSGHSDGIGLGLSLCHRIVSLHGGRIWIDDGLDGVGIAMCFTLPVTPVTRDASMSPRVRRALDEMWPGVHEASRVHLSHIEALLLADGDATPAQHLAACSAAHRLNGGLGMFGRHEASAVAAEIESLLTMDLTTSRPELRTLVDRLDALLGMTTY
ncbi:MAG: ATP-binding protein [Acidimicrobiales bacterium]